MALYEVVLPLVFHFVLVLSKGPPEFLHRIERYQVARAGDTLRLPCPVEADPPPLLQWSKDGQLINSGWDRFRMLSRGHLKIRDLEEEDSGMYTCKATNGFGSVTLEYKLYVGADNNGTEVTPPPGWADEDLDENGHAGIKPTFTRPEQMRKNHIMRPVGNTLKLKCKATGKPRPQIVWYKDGSIVEGDEDLPVDPEDHDHHWTLKLRDLQPQDSGNYLCKVFNRMGAINHTYVLEVVDRLQEPKIVSPQPENTTVLAGESAVFQCCVQSEVQPSIQWLKRLDDPTDKSNVNSTITVNGSRFVVLKAGQVWARNDGSYLNKLTLQDVTEKDAGMYICLGANSRGYTFKSAYLTILPGMLLDHNSYSKESSSSTALSMPLIIAISVIAFAIVLAIIIFLVHRGTRKNTTPTKKPKTGAVAVPHRQNHGMTLSEKHYDYKAVPHSMPSANSHDHSMVSYPDVHSDVSTGKMAPASAVQTPPPSMMLPPHMHQHQQYPAVGMHQHPIPYPQGHPQTHPQGLHPGHPQGIPPHMIHGHPPHLHPFGEPTQHTIYQSC